MLKQSADELDKDQFCLGVSNGWLNLKNNTFLGPDPLKMITKSVKSDFVTNAEAQLWEKILQDIFEGDQSLIDFFQRAVGYSLLGDKKNNAFLSVMDLVQMESLLSLKLLKIYSVNTPRQCQLKFFLRGKKMLVQHHLKQHV